MGLKFWNYLHLFPLTVSVWEDIDADRSEAHEVDDADICEDVGDEGGKPDDKEEEEKGGRGGSEGGGQLQAAAQERREVVDEGEEGKGEQKKEKADGSKNGYVLESRGEYCWVVDVGVAQQHRSAEGKFLMEKKQGEEKLGGEALEGGVGVGGEDEGDGEEEAKKAKGTRPADHKVHPSPTLSLSERGVVICNLDKYHECLQIY